MPEKAEWDWYPYSPRGELTIIGGDPGARKSTLTRYIALATLKGLPLPNDPPGMRRQPGRVLMLSTEDSLTKTVVPQLLKWGATKNDLRRLYLLEEDFTLDAEGVAMVERAIEELKPDMVFLDPIVSFIGSDVDMNSQNQVRNVLRPLAGLAKRHNVPIVTVAHARKSGGRARFRGLLRSGPLRHHGLSGRGWDQHHDPSQG